VKTFRRSAEVVVLSLVMACATPDTDLSTRTTPAPQAVACRDLPAIVSDTDVPTLPVGIDAYRQWERWPIVRIGTRVHAKHLRA
jgi:hypothetical protein